MSTHRNVSTLWWMVPAYAAHIVEEWRMGFPAWVARFIHQPMPVTGFLIVNAVFWLLMLWAVASAVRDASRAWLGVGVATILVINAFTHIAGSLITGGYAPGVVTAVVFYLPLGVMILPRARAEMPASQFRRGVLAGAVVHAAVFVVAFGVSRLS